MHGGVNHVSGTFCKGVIRPLILMQLALLASHPQFSLLNAAFWTQLDAISRLFFQLDAGSDVFLQGGQMKLRARQKYDYRDLDRGESKLIRIGHALCEIVENWAIRYVSVTSWPSVGALNKIPRGAIPSASVFESIAFRGPTRRSVPFEKVSFGVSAGEFSRLCRQNLSAVPPGK